ncbi:MAG: stage V sporulation protein AC [Clostridiales bacterium]|nr:stage V sporulation protein AC [Clostridiales bacterium]
MAVDKMEYDRMLKKASPNSKAYINIPMAFIIGGLICVLGQFLMTSYEKLGISTYFSGTVTSITLIFLSALLTGLNLYDNIAKHGGAGTLVPITGFANAVVAPALEFKAEGLILGLGAKLFVIAGPVIVYGVTASVIYGLIIYMFKLV